MILLHSPCSSFRLEGRNDVQGFTARTFMFSLENRSSHASTRNDVQDECCKNGFTHSYCRAAAVMPQRGMMLLEVKF